jgi:hypothetical protein
MVGLFSDNTPGRAERQSLDCCFARLSRSRDAR